MKRDFSEQVKDWTGKPFVRAVMQYDRLGMPVMESQGNAKVHAFSHHEPMTLRSFALDALAGRWAGEERIERSVLTHRIRLYDKLCFSTTAVVDLEPADLQVILDALYSQQVSALVFARMETMLSTDPPTKEPAHEQPAAADANA